jgi:hypothetical protein
MLAAIAAALPSARVESISVTDLDVQLAAISGPTVYVVYGAGEAGEPNSACMHIQDNVWSWSLFCLAKDYRGAEASGSALAVLEAVDEVLVGRAFEAGGSRPLTVSKQRDTLMDLPDEVRKRARGLCGYELVVYVQTQIRK